MFNISAVLANTGKNPKSGYVTKISKVCWASYTRLQLLSKVTIMPIRST